MEYFTEDGEPTEVTLRQVKEVSEIYIAFVTQGFTTHEAVQLTAMYITLVGLQ